MRRCFSQSDLSRTRRFQEHTQAEVETSDLESFKPLKRSRSDQSLPACAQANPSPSSDTGEFGQQPSCTQAYLSPKCTPASSKVNSHRVQRFPSLPVVLSDVGSSTGSLLSLELEVVGPDAQQQSLAQARSAHTVTPAAAANSKSAVGCAQQSPLSHTDVDLISSFANRSYGALYSLANVSSAASLTQAQFATRGSGPLCRTASDASVSSAGGQSYLAGLQQLVPPLPPYSPPPLFSPGPPASGAAPNLFASPKEPGTGLYAATSSMLRQKQAAAAGASNGCVPSIRGGWTGSPGHGRGVSSIGSLDSITSVEAGEHLIGFGYMVAGGSPAPQPALPADAGTDLPASSAAAAGAMHNQAALLQVENPVSRFQLVSSAESNGVSVDLAGRPAAQFADMALHQMHDGCEAATKERISSALSKPGVLHSDCFGSHVLHQMKPAPSSQLSNLSPECCVELQTMSSMLGCEGEQLLLPPEYSTGAIDPFNAIRLVGFMQAAVNSVQTSLPTVQQAAAAVQSCGSAEAAQTAAICAASVAAAAAAQQVAVSAGSVAEGLGRQAVNAVARPPRTAGSTGTEAAHGSFAGVAAPGHTQAAPVTVSSALPAAAPGTTSIGLSSGSKSSAAAVPSLAGFGFRQGPVTTGDSVFSLGAAGAAAAAAAAKAFAPDKASAFVSHLQLAFTHGSTACVQREQAHLGLQPSSSSLPASTPLPLPPHDGIKQEAFTQPGTLQAQPRQAGSSLCRFGRHAASFDCARSVSSRTRGSLELNMPWRSQLDAVIAQASADGPEAANQQRSSWGAGLVSSATSVHSAQHQDDSVELLTLHDDPFSSFAAVELSDPGLRQQSSRGTLHNLGSGMLLPLLESDQEQQLSDAAASAEASAEALVMYLGHGAEGNAALQSGSSTSSGTSRISGIASYPLPSGSMVGGYAGASDIARGASASLSELETARSYGLEFDGAVVMQSVELNGAQWSEGMELLAGVHLQQQQEQEQEQSQQQPEGTGSCCLVGEQSYGGDEHMYGLSQQQQQQLASLGSPPVESRLRLAAATRKHAPVGEEQERSTTLMGLDGQQESVQAASSLHEQQQQEGGPQVAETAEAAVQLGQHTPLDLAPEFVSGNSFSSSISSISTPSSAGLYARRGAGSSSSSAAYELFIRLNRARQTLDYAKRQAEMFAELNRAELGVWEALDLLNTLREYEAAVLYGLRSSGRSSSSGGEDMKQSEAGAVVSKASFSDSGGVSPDMPLRDHALQVAELCRLSFPDKPWMALVGLLHGLGKLLAHPIWGSRPQWAVAGESYPVGCKFAPQISHSEFFSANPDRRRRAYSTALGIYQPGCGLRNVYMSWGAPEYMYMLLVLNQTQLPEEALFMIRYQRCLALTRPGGAYRQLMSDMDKSLLPLLAAFQGLIAYRRVQMPPEALTGDELIEYYDKLIARYLGEEKLFW